VSGFVGVVNMDQAPIDGARLRQMTAYMGFRVPDARHVWHDGHVGFGHALLRSTFESAHERQPCSLDGRSDLLHGLRSIGREVAEQAPDVEMILHQCTAVVCRNDYGDERRPVFIHSTAEANVVHRPEA
jgi:asparagine synthase (glutamine-hydrolysing)